LLFTIPPCASQTLGPALKVVLLMLVVTGIAYPLIDSNRSKRATVSIERQYSYF